MSLHKVVSLSRTQKTQHELEPETKKKMDQAPRRMMKGVQVNYSLDVSVKLARPPPFRGRPVSDRSVRSGEVGVGRNRKFGDNMREKWRKVTRDTTKERRVQTHRIRQATRTMRRCMSLDCTDLVTKSLSSCRTGSWQRWH